MVVSSYFFIIQILFATNTVKSDENISNISTTDANTLITTESIGGKVSSEFYEMSSAMENKSFFEYTENPEKIPSVEHSTTTERMNRTKKTEFLKTEIPLTTTEMTTESSTVPSHENTTIWSDASIIPFIPSANCSCDIQKSVCDANCCCDPDCSAIDRSVFSTCHLQPNHSVDSRYCYSSLFIYRNNTQLKIQQETNSGLFCILRDNFPPKSLYENPQIMRDISDIRKFERMIRRYSWPSLELSHLEKVNPISEYKVGSTIWTVNNNSKFLPWSVPISKVSSFCHSKKKLLYMTDWESSCQTAINDEESCLDNVHNPELYFKDFKLLQSSAISNISKYEDCNETSCFSFKPFLCQPGFSNCTKITNSVKTYHVKSKNMCVNVLHSLKYVITHNGTKGIYEANAYFQLQNISLSMSKLKFRKNYRIIFKWVNQTNNTFVRSGFPGYLYGKPVISGFKIQSNLSNEINTTVIKFHNDSKFWISIAGFNDELSCDGSLRKNILFGENFYTTCQYIFRSDKLSTPEACSALNTNILELLIGQPVTNDVVNMFISSFGDPQPKSDKEWIPISLNGQKEHDCSNLITTMKINIFYAFVGSVLNPQAKIIGVSYDFKKTSSTSQNLFCHSKICVAALSSFVSFIDTTRATYFKFAEIPVYEIKLPQDFFYPFFSSTCKLQTNVYYLFFSVFVSIILNHKVCI